MEEEELIADIWDVTAGVALMLAGAFLWNGGDRGSKIWGALMILLGVVVLMLNMLGLI